MKLAASMAYLNRYFRNEETFAKLREIGYHYVDIALGGNRFFSQDETEWKAAVDDIAENAAKHGITFIQAHSPNSNPVIDTRLEKEYFYATRSLEICDRLGVKDLVVHAGYDSNLGKTEWYEKNRDFYRLLFPLMEKTEINVLTENTTKYNLNRGFYMYTGADMVEFIEYVDHPLFNAVWDTGHGNSEGSHYDNVVALGKYLRGLHVHDNNGVSDQHGIPYTGVLNLDSLICGLIDIGYKGYFTYETLNALQPSNGRTKRMTFERETRLLEPTAEMAVAAENLIYTIGKCALEAYGIFEE